MKYVFVALVSLTLVGCITGRKPPPPEVITQTQLVFQKVPEEYFERDGEPTCPPPPITNDELIELVEFENQYNEELVLKLFDNNRNCYFQSQRIQRWNDSRPLVDNSSEEQ